MQRFLLNIEDFKIAQKEFKKEVANCNKVLENSIDANDIVHAWKKLAESYWMMDAAARDVKDAIREKVWQAVSITDC